MIIPYKKLSPDTLKRLIEEFVTRPGTDTGYTKTDLEQNVAMVIKQLQQKRAFIVFDDVTETADIVSKDSLSKEKK